MQKVILYSEGNSQQRKKKDASGGKKRSIPIVKKGGRFEVEEKNKGSRMCRISQTQKVRRRYLRTSTLEKLLK